MLENNTPNAIYILLLCTYGVVCNIEIMNYEKVIFRLNEKVFPSSKFSEAFKKVTLCLWEIFHFFASL